MDLVAAVDRRPVAGETVPGRSLALIPGGKGANQAVAAARMGCRTAMVGLVGEDAFGRTLLESLAAEGIDARHVGVRPGVSTGTAVVVVDGAGDNSIIVIPGANGEMGVAEVSAAAGALSAARVLLLQLEIPLPAVIHAARLAREQGVTVILDPAPAQPLPAELLQLVDYLTPNATEATALSGVPVTGPEGARRAAEVLRRQGAARIVVKLGAGGALYLGPEGEIQVPGFPVPVVDTTAAGDAFAGGLAAALLAGCSPAEALRWACAAGAVAVTRPGAQPSMPRRPEVEALLAGGDVG